MFLNRAQAALARGTPYVPCQITMRPGPALELGQAAGDGTHLFDKGALFSDRSASATPAKRIGNRMDMRSANTAAATD